MISSTAGLTSFLQSHLKHSFRPPFGFPPWPLYSLRPQPTSQMRGIATQVPHPWYSLSSTWTPLLRLGSLPSSSYLGTKTFHKSFAKLPGQVAGAAKKISTTSQALQKKPAPYPPPLSHIYLHNPSFWPYLGISSPPPSVLLLPSFLPPPLINTAPCLTIIRATSFLHSITPLTREKPPHAFIWSSNEEIPAAKMTVNKQKANLKNIQCSHQWGDLLFGHRTSIKFGWQWGAKKTTKFLLPIAKFSMVFVFSFGILVFVLFFLKNALVNTGRRMPEGGGYVGSKNISSTALCIL